MISNKEIIAIDKRIKGIRNTRNITQEKLAEISERTLAHISNIESGHSKMSIISHFLDKHSIMVYSWTIKMSSNGQNKESQT